MAKKQAKKRTEGKKAGESGSDTKQIPDWYSVTDLEQLAVLANPKRQRILGEFVDDARTTKQVAEILGEPPTRLYHHVDALAKHGLLVLEREVPKRGTTEKYYRAVARQFRVDESCLSDPAFADENSRMITGLLNDARDALLKAVADAAEDPENAMHSTATSALVHTTEKGIESAAESFVTQLDRLSQQSSVSKKDAKQNYRIVLLIFPEPEPD
ncbi:MAG: helix-turn-helix domain-containing protein [Pirellulaceae bacterium]